MEKMFDKFRDIIRQQLPETVGKELRIYLEKAEVDAKEVKRLQDVGFEFDAITKEQSDNIVRLINEKGELEKRVETQEKLDERKRDFDMELLKKENEHLEGRRKEIFNLVDKVFGHPKVTIREAGTVPIAIEGAGDSYGGSVQSGQINKIVETEESKS